MNFRTNLHRIRLSAAALLLVAAASAQETPAPPPSIEYGRLTITGYELREERLNPPFRTWSDGKETLHQYAFKVVIRGGRFPVRALDPILWIGDTPVRNYERELFADGESLLFCVTDPALLRAERDLTVIYGTDERTRTRLIERLDPERLVKLPAAERAASGLPELEGVTLTAVGADGRIAGRGRLAAGRIALVVRLDDGKLVPLATEVALDAQGRFAVAAGPLPARASHVAALLLTGERAAAAAGAATLAGVELAALPKGIELLDSKAIRR
ncbi:MAG: hypothetical protein JNL90_14640 [Planctomycetes bacterium]|nr:hypothetical protein [Planctomycetota bacterium]